MACCLTAPSHYLNQCWLIIGKVQWPLSDGNHKRGTSAMNHLYKLEEKNLSKISLKYARGQWLTINKCVWLWCQADWFCEVPAYQITVLTASMFHSIIVCSVWINWLHCFSTLNLRATRYHRAISRHTLFIIWAYQCIVSQCDKKLIVFILRNTLKYQYRFFMRWHFA